MAKVTIPTLETWLNNESLSLFDSLQIPDGLDADTMHDTILYTCADMACIWANPYFVRNMVGVWSAKNLDSWTRMYTALYSEYNPIHNYNRTETETRDLEHGETESVTNTSNGTDENTSVHKVTGYDSDSDLLERDSITSSGTQTNTNNGTRRGTNTDTGTIIRNTQGNIGVTTNQRMIESEITMRDKYNIYHIIADSFIDEFCVAVY